MRAALALIALLFPGTVLEAAAQSRSPSQIGGLARATVTGDLHGQAALLWSASEMVRK